MENKEIIAKVNQKLLVGGNVFLYGARKFGHIALMNLRTQKIEPTAFVDDSLKAQGSVVDGLKVISLHDAIARDKNALFIVTCPYYTSVLKHLDGADVSSENIIFSQQLMIDELEVSVASHRDEIQALYDGLGDNKSRKILERMTLGRVDGDLYELSMLKDEIQYFPEDIFEYGDEVLLDGGAFIGDTICSFQDFCGDRNICFKKAYAFEPDQNNWDRLINNGDIKVNVEYINAGLSDRNEKLSFVSGEGGSSMIDENGTSSIEVVAADTLVFEDVPTIIKMDIEGAELAALHGMQKLIREHKPKLAICIYHKQSDIWEIPSYIKGLVPEYNFYIRNYTNWLDEIVLYATI